VLAATGMSACFGTAVRAPFTAILMIFEMTHQFGMVPALMLGTVISQTVARLAGPSNFYEEVLLQDGHEIHRSPRPRTSPAGATCRFPCSRTRSPSPSPAWPPKR
jgi:CIC family chloride channel protein